MTNSQKQTQKRRSECPIVYTLDIVGDRWAILIIRDIALRNKTTFGDFVNSEEAISTNILSSRLKKLEDQDIISKKKAVDNLSKFIYALTDKGFDLLPLIVEMIIFAGDHDEKSVVSKKFLNKLKRDKSEFIEDVRKAHE